MDWASQPNHPIGTWAIWRVLAAQFSFEKFKVFLSWCPYLLKIPSVTGLILSNAWGSNLEPRFFLLKSLTILGWFGTLERRGLILGLKDCLKVESVLFILESAVVVALLWLEISF